MQKLLVISFILFAFFSSPKQKTLKGTWEYRGGKFNNKLSPAPKGYSQQRKYTDTQFEAFAIEKGQKDLRYEAGNYALKGDTCSETQTFCLQSQNLIGVTIRYHYTVRNDTLFLRAKLPNGTVEEDYWKKIK